MANGFAELADLLKAGLAPFSPRPYLEPETDSLIFYARNEPSYSKRLNSLFTLFLSAKDHTLVGCEIKGVTGILRRSKSFIGVFRDHKIKLTILIALALAPEPESGELDEDSYMPALNKLREYADDQEVDAGELCFAE